MTEVRDNKALSRFELDVEGGWRLRIIASRRRRSSSPTPRRRVALRGRGIASELVAGALQLIRADGLKVVAGCSFVVDYLRKHPEFADLVG